MWKKNGSFLENNTDFEVEVLIAVERLELNLDNRLISDF